MAEHFVDTGITAEAVGASVAASGLWGVHVDENGDLILSYVGDEAPPLSIDENGNLIYTLSGNQIIIGNVGTGGGGSGGTMNYELLLNKPSINGIPLQGNLTTEELGIRDGQDGAPGADGAPGKAATIRVGSVTSGDTLSVTNSGTETDAVLDFVLKPGPQGPAGEGVPPVSGGSDGDVLTISEGVPAWAALAGGNTPAELVIDDTTGEDAAYLYYNQDSAGKPFGYQHVAVLITMPTAPEPVTTSRGAWFRYDDGHIGPSGVQYAYAGASNSNPIAYGRIVNAEIRLLPASPACYISYSGQTGTANSLYVVNRKDDAQISKIGEIKFLMSDSSLVPAGTRVQIWKL